MVRSIPWTHYTFLPCLALPCCLALPVLVVGVVVGMVVVVGGEDGRGCILLSSGEYTLMDLDIQTLIPVQLSHLCVCAWGRYKF